ncbi:MAG: tetratricopeptide repeat protein [Caulobacteraceae bacterium]
MKGSCLIGAAALALILAGPAAAAVTVMGDNTALECSQAAFHDRSDDASVRNCTVALTDGLLDRRDLAGTYINRGVLWMDRGAYASARSDFDHAIGIDPALGEAWVNRGAVNILDQRYKDGISDIDRGLTLGIEQPAKAYYNRAVAYEGIDDEKSAYLDYEQALALAPTWELPRQELLRFSVTRK